jgi:hypothetical protein
MIGNEQVAIMSVGRFMPTPLMAAPANAFHQRFGFAKTHVGLKLKL